MAKKTIQKPRDFPVNPYINYTPKGFFEKLVVPIMMQIVEERDQQILREVKRLSQVHHCPWFVHEIKYPRVPFDPFFWTIIKRDKQIKKYLMEKRSKCVQ